jgi:hypothetical protein
MLYYALFHSFIALETRGAALIIAKLKVDYET